MEKAAIDEVYSWASQLASESRGQGWVTHGYVWPDAVAHIVQQLKTTRDGIICLVGLQGVGKSSALCAIHSKMELDSVLFKWRRPDELYKCLIDGSHMASQIFLREYLKALLEKRSSGYSSHASSESSLLHGIEDLRQGIRTIFLERLNDPNVNVGSFGLESFESGRSRDELGKLRETAWLSILRSKKIVLIDTPDYSKTDRRAMAKDLQEIHWLWIKMIGSGAGPNIVLAIQKEMFGGHFFLDKMQKINLEPLRPRQMLEAYTRRFKLTEPFVEEALLTLARMSRGVFRRFLRYIMLTLDLWQTRHEPRELIDPATVKEAVTIERLAEDMELELAEVFPRQSDAPRQAVRVLMELEEHGPLKQGDLGERLGIEDYSLSRLLAKLELHRHVTRERSGTDKIVDLART